MRVLIAAGGTGGHLVPALATADALRRLAPSISILFLTAGRSIGERFFEGRTDAREALFAEHDSAPGKRDLLAWWRAYRRARMLLRDFEPDVVVGLGGYPAFIAGLASISAGPGPVGLLVAAARWLLGAGRRSGGPPAARPARFPPLILLEQNARPGRATRILSRVCRQVLLSLTQAEGGLPRGTTSRWTGNPLPAEFGACDGGPPDPREFGLEPGRPTLVVLGGSQGARGVNRMVLGARSELGSRHPDLQILMITGETDHREVSEALAQQPEPRTVALPFETRMKDAYRVADVVVARAGGTTLAELSVIGRPMVLVPYPHHRDGHQFANAAVFEQAGAARVVREGPQACSALVEHLDRWLSDPAARKRDGDLALELGRGDAATECARLILECAGHPAGDPGSSGEQGG